jgi:uncharacterized protein (DUF924 family)
VDGGARGSLGVYDARCRGASTGARLLTPDQVHEFWFADAADDPAKAHRRTAFWFHAGRDIDETIADRFASTLAAAGDGRLSDWESRPRACLALIVVLDQCPRNIYRGSASAYRYDARALALARRGVAAGQLRALTPIEQAFFLMPFQHCEDLRGQREGFALFKGIADEVPPDWHTVMDRVLHYARLHLEIVERFGRFPHRNAVLGRPSTAAELEYLATNGESFGQSATS